MSKKYMAHQAEAVAVRGKEPRYMYIGANLPAAGLLRYQVFIGGKPPVVDNIKTKYPLIEQLFVPIKDIERARSQVKTKGTALYLANQQIINGGER